MKKWIKNKVKSSISKLGYSFKKLEKNINQPSTNSKDFLLKNFYLTLKEFNFQPKHIVDIGANHGTWTRETLNYFPHAFYTLVEPQSWLKESIKDILEENNKINFHPFGAGKSEGSFHFTIHDRDDSCSFRYNSEEAKGKGYKQIEIPVITLNTLLSDSNLPTPDIIKIDAEGMDLEVLDGASNFFGITEVFMVEAGVMNKSFDNSFIKLINYMDENGYCLFDITDINRPFQPKVLWLVELVFVLKNGYLDSQNSIDI